MKNPLLELQEYENLLDGLHNKKGPLLVSGVMDSQKVHLMYELIEDLGQTWQLVVTYDEQKAKDIYDDFSCFTDKVCYFPPRDTLFFSADIHGNLMTRQRISVLKRLISEDGGIVITTVDGLMDQVVPLSDIKERIVLLETGARLDLGNFTQQLTELGYERVPQVDGMGQFSVKGGIIDIFPLTEETPLRIELWDNEVDSIRYFDVESQRSIEVLEKISVFPAAELILTQSQRQKGCSCLKEALIKEERKLRQAGKIEEASNLHVVMTELIDGLSERGHAGGMEGFIGYFYGKKVTFQDYFEKNETILFLDEPARLKERSEAVENEFKESMRLRLESGNLLRGQMDILKDSVKVMEELQTGNTVMLMGLDMRLPGMKVNARFNFEVKNINTYQNNFVLLTGDLLQWKKNGCRVILLSASRTRAGRLAEDLRGYGLSAYCPDSSMELPESSKKTFVSWRYRFNIDSIRPGEVLVTYGNLHRGFEYPLLKLIFITEGDIFGLRKRKTHRKKSYQGSAIRNFSELSIGDYVVHEEHGMGIYRGIEKVEREKVIKDYIKIEYDGGNLFIPATRMEAIQKYVGSDGVKPKINKLGGTEWTKVRTKVNKAVHETAADLLRLYAARQGKKGFPYSQDTVWQKEFEELFPYEETEDQLEAIRAVKEDMESDKIMDRLICGDVGYGKTEIALRAAFKAVQDSKQVVYLVPTTVLAQQHYNTFVQRMKNFPVTVGMLSRFSTPAQQKKTLEGIRKGLVDIVIGTHRVLSKDLVFKDLGLLIIDEEQRFGVSHKEKIKRLKENVDVMTLTATPIPRTLHMSLSGIRDMSVLEEPPVDRIPVQTYVMEYNDETVREAITRELARRGQVYYVYNRVTSIKEITSGIQALVPQAVVAYAHGQMRERELERIMADFVNGEIDVLVSTTIIETGLDIPNANTMIIQDADRMGLSQLYQLRGRVGRSSRTAYAFLMYKRDKLLKEEAQKRLQAIREFTELGSGIRIAMRDLEIRGAGNVLGAQQHGHMEAVGYDLYCKLLNRAVLELKGEVHIEEPFETEITCDINAFIPTSYIRNEYQKLDVYKRISLIETQDEYMDMQDELVDRFGIMPVCVENLLKIALLKGLAHFAYVTEVSINRQEARFMLYKNARLDTQGLIDLMGTYNGALRMSAGKIPILTLTDKKKNKDSLKMLEQAKDLLIELGKLRLV